ncbi:MarR family winged helix-turn-helix transcriptional regulator [Frondihabitans sp. PAMC 28766]|uniref:MarR family winged helix-turn-helix transcriptional regulator n=1 Tax=Frondihabitans sp. PAMC 28766 TaxID=1795630 RepID=UPI0012FFC48E|nr:MarR family transcriptional regulator [Frondihabitans sp. PAMC 28766]
MNDPEVIAPVESTLVASRALLGIVARSVASALEVVTLPQFRVLVLLSTGGPTRVGTLAEQVGAVPSTFSRSVDRMVAGGWVERSLRESNRREIILNLTPDGRHLVDSVTERRRHEIRDVLKTMSPEDQQTIASAFHLFTAAAGEPTVADLLTLGL